MYINIDTFVSLFLAGRTLREIFIIDILLTPLGFLPRNQKLGSLPRDSPPLFLISGWNDFFLSEVLINESEYHFLKSLSGAELGIRFIIHLLLKGLLWMQRRVQPVEPPLREEDFQCKVPAESDKYQDDHFEATSQETLVRIRSQESFYL